MQSASVAQRQRTLLLVVGLLLFSVALFSESVSAAAIPDAEWNLPTDNLLFLEGPDEDTVNLSRTAPAVPGPPGWVTFNMGSDLLFSATSAPAVDWVNTTVDISVELYVSLDQQQSNCRLLVFGGGQTVFSVTLQIGNNVPLQDVPTQKRFIQAADWSEAELFNASLNDVEFSLSPGEVVILSVSVNHECPQTANLWWGGYDTPSGVRITGEMLSPNLTVHTDDNNLPRIEMIPYGPWGLDDIISQQLDIVGPFDEWDEIEHGIRELDLHVETFVDADGTRPIDAERSALMWVGNKTLKPGKYMLDVCLRTADGPFEDDCHAIGVIRFEVESDSGFSIGAGWLVGLALVGLIGYIIIRLRSKMLPVPALVLLLALTLLAINPIMALPTLESESREREQAAPNFTLLTHGGGQISLSDLLDGKEAVVIGVFEAGSPNSEIQKRDFDNVTSKTAAHASFIQLITGDDMRSIDADKHADLLNGSWALLLDEADSGVARQLPTGAADGVVVIDAAGFITASQPGSMSSSAIGRNIISASGGSDQSPFSLFSVWWLLIPLVLLALPKKKTEVPEAALFPGAGVLSTIGAGCLGFLIWSLPVFLLAALVGGAAWSLVEIGLALWLCWNAVSMIWKGRIVEIDRIGRLLHSRLPQGFREWRSASEFSRDMWLGTWVAWLGWIVQPLLIAQGVGTLAVVSWTGWLVGPLLLLLISLLAGLLVLSLRAVAAAAGPFSRMGGYLCRSELDRWWGCLAAGIGVWSLIYILVGPLGLLS